MVQELSKIWYNRRFVPWKEAKIHILTHALHYGSGVFEGIRCYNTVKGPVVFRLKDHIDRLFKSAEAMLLNIPFTKEQLIEATKELIRRNNVKECYIRPIVFTGYGPMGLDTTNCPIDVAIIVWPWGAYLGEEGLEKGIKCKISSQTRFHDKVSISKICGNYTRSILAKREAIASSYDEAIIFDDKGFLAEGSGENIFIIKDNQIYTSKLGAVLRGITRDSVFEIVKRGEGEIIEKDLTKDDLLMANEAFFTGTAAELTPIRQVNNTIIGAGKRGPMTEKIQSKFFDIVHGKDEDYEGWLDFI